MNLSLARAIPSREIRSRGWKERFPELAADPAATRPHVSIVVPVWNGGPRLSRTLSALGELATRGPGDLELIVVDDCSDATTQRVLERARDHASITVLRNDRNRGKGHSVRRGMLAAQGALRVFTDADLPYPEEIESVLEALENGCDMAVACRRHPESRYLVIAGAVPQFLARQAVSRGFNALARRVLVNDVLDTQAGLKGFTAAAAELVFSRVTIERFGFDLECLYIAQRFGLRVAQLPVTCLVEDTQSTVCLVRDGARMLRDLATVRLNAWRGRYA